ncbi:L,D-transpeptidase family protein [Streptomyces sp. NPDC050856]|uniref:L,D-transpeptidase family protein n=1 Tax=Streptomyces sp. NPDC050856 TaxID=3154939 RepID=UPI0033F6E7FC
MRRRALTRALLLLPLTLTACADPSGVREDHSARSPQGRTDRIDPRPRKAAPREIPALGPATRARIPAPTRQAVVVTGDAPDSARSTVVLYEREPGQGWQPVSDPWPAHNALKGWTDHHVQGDLRSPIGVFTLTDAGGLLPDPGTELPYDQGPGFTARGTGTQGEPLAGAFDHVVAIDYNRRPGTTPLDWTRPLGPGRGGGIWIHVDHNGPTEGCVSLKKPRMRELLTWLDPAKRPVVVMGDVTSLGR